MKKLSVFNNISLDGYFVDSHGEMNFAQNQAPDPEWDAFIAGNTSGGGGIMLFGRITYQMMAAFWPTPEAVAAMPVVANTMNNARKVVFSRTLEGAEWNNSQLLKDELLGNVRRLKEEAGPDIVIFGSGTIVTQLAQEDLIDEYVFVIVPVVLGQGRTMFEGLDTPRSMTLLESRSFKNGNVVLRYTPARAA
jgi:dihydrofolate reductase